MNKNLSRIAITMLFATVLLSCSKTTTKGCFDQQLYDQHKNDACIENCPGVKGCDGKTYCNECIANSKGIRVVK